MAKAKGVAAKPPSPIPLQLFGPHQRALFDALIAAKPPEPPSLTSPPKARAARPAKKNEQDTKVDTPMEVDAKPRAAARKPAKPRTPKKKDPSDDTTVSDDSTAEVKRKKKAVVKEAKVVKKKSGKISNTFYKSVADASGLTAQDIKKALLSTQKIVGESIKTNGKSRMPTFLTFKCKVIKQRPAKEKNLFGNIVKLPERPEKKVALTL